MGAGNLQKAQLRSWAKNSSQTRAADTWNDRAAAAWSAGLEAFLVLLTLLQTRRSPKRNLTGSV